MASQSLGDTKRLIGELPKATILGAVDPALKKYYIDAKLKSTAVEVLRAIVGGKVYYSARECGGQTQEQLRYRHFHSGTWAPHSLSQGYSRVVVDQTIRYHETT